MAEDPLPAPAARYNIIFPRMELRIRNKCVAITLCLFLVLALALCPHVIFEESQSGLGILKHNSSINQAPRAVFFFGALAVLPQRVTLDNVALLQIRGNNGGTLEAPIQKIKNWLVMVWYGSTYV